MEKTRTAMNATLVRMQERVEQNEKRLDPVEAKRHEILPHESPVQAVSRTLVSRIPSRIPTPHYVANTSSHKVHQDTCVFTRQILPENRQEITAGLAARKGFDLCICWVGVSV